MTGRDKIPCIKFLLGCKSAFAFKHLVLKLEEKEGGHLVKSACLPYTAHVIQQHNQGLEQHFRANYIYSFRPHNG